MDTNPTQDSFYTFLMKGGGINLEQAFFLPPHSQQEFDPICSSQGCCEAPGLVALPGANGGRLEKHVLNPWKHLAQPVCFPKRHEIFLS